MVGLVIAILVIFILNLFWPSNQVDAPDMSFKEDTKSQAVNLNAATSNSVATSDVLTTPGNDEKVSLMKAEYEVLEAERKKLQRRLSRLKHDMWGLKFVPEKAKQINEIMMNAHKLIKNPYLLGAFSSVKAIQDEIAKIKFAEKSVEQVSAMIEENKNSSQSTG